MYTQMCSELSNETRKSRICEGQCSNEISNSVSCKNFEECKRTPTIDQEEDQLPSHYLEKKVFCLLLPAVEETLIEASRWNALRVQKCRFNGLDYIAELLWNYNPRRSKVHSPMLNVFEIPLFKQYLLQHPRPYYPKSWLWSEEHAALRIQRCIRGWLVRKRDDVQEMRQFWKNIAGKKLDHLPGSSGETEDPNLIRCEMYRSMFSKYKTMQMKAHSDSKRLHQ